MAKDSGKEMLDRLTDLRNNPIEYEKTLKAMEVISKATFMASGTINYAVSEKTLMDAVDLIGKNLPVSKYYKLGKFMVEKSIKIRKITEDIRQVEDGKAYGGELKLGKAYWESQKKIDKEFGNLFKAIKENREQLAKEMGVSPDSLKELPRIGLGSKVPPLPASLK